MKTLLTLILSIFCLTGYSQIGVYSSGGGSSNIDEAAVGSQISDSLANLAITVNVLSTADTVFAIHNDSLVAIPVTAITTPLQDDIDSINNVVQNIYTLLSGLGYDLVAPSLDSIVLGGLGPSDYIFRLYFNEQLNQDSVPSHLDFTVTENGNAFDLSSSGVSNNMVTVSGATPAYGNTYLLSYAKGDTAIQDTAGNKVANWTGHTVVNRLPAPEPFCDEYQAVYDLMAVKPGLDTAVIQNIIVRSLVDSGYWERMDWFYWLAQKDSTASLLNWENPGAFSLTKSGVPTWTKYEGWTGDGVDAFLSTNWDAATNAINFKQDSATIGVYVLSETSVTVPAIGTTTTASYCMIEPLYNTSWLSAFINGGQILVSGRSTSRGLFMITRTASNAIEVYHNGASLGSDTDASGALRTDDFVILRNGTSYYTGQVAVAFSMDGISDTEAANINTIIETGMDGIGKGVQ